MLRVAIKIVVALVGIALTAVFLILSIRDRSPLAGVQAVVAATVTFQLLSALRRNSATAGEKPRGPGNNKNAKLIAIGLAIGFGAPVLIMWVIMSVVR